MVFSGDTRQIQSVEACDALRILEKESRLTSIALTQVQRQTQLDYRDAIQELRRDPERGFEKLDAMGAVREVYARRPRPGSGATIFGGSGDAGVGSCGLCDTQRN